jgi:hypothetical protein
MEQHGRGQVLGDKARAYIRPVPLHRTAVGLTGEQDLTDPYHQEWIHYHHDYDYDHEGPDEGAGDFADRTKISHHIT